MENNAQINEDNFPGYPHYAAKEDIMNSKDNERVDLDVDNLSKSKLVSPPLPAKSVVPPQQQGKEESPLSEIDDDVEDNAGSDDTDITPEDLLALGADEGNTGSLKSLADNDLDVPGAEDDNANEAIGEEDEENNYYSLGGDAHENLEEDKGG